MPAMKVDQILNIEELHRVAKRRVPRIVFDYFEGGVEDEHGLARNEAAYRGYQIVPRYLEDVSSVDTTATLFGRSYASPFGIGPTALGGLLRPGADLMLAEAAAAANIPYVMSTLSNTPLEAAARIVPEHAWFQLYGAQDRKISADLIRRASDAGMNGLVFTVDVPVITKREREMRNRFGQSPMPLWAYVEALRHPAWLMDYLRHGRPVFENWVPYAGGGRSDAAVMNVLRTQFPVANHTWKDLEAFRRLWPRTLVVKGFMHADDAVRAAELGVDGVVISNHGARQLDTAPAALTVLPAIRAAVGEKLTVMLDGGVRRGSDIVVAWALGARFVFIGRPTIYGVAAYGLPGAKRAIAILQEEIKLTMQQMGCTSLERLGPECLLRGG
jgi:isopentenyl diphosphate isomerase/L-lactate dehydrogenase-like FMN-dependent dehydrogenase